MSDLFILADYTLTAAHNTPNISGYFIQTGISFRALTEGQPALSGNVFYTIYVTIVRCYLRNDLVHISYCCRILSGGRRAFYNFLALDNKTLHQTGNINKRYKSRPESGHHHQPAL